MSVAIIGGNECMIRRYAELCNDYKCKVKVYPKMTVDMVAPVVEEYRAMGGANSGFSARIV